MRLVLPAAAADGPADRADLAALYGADRPRLEARPWLGVCMITGLDGSTAVDGVSGRLGAAGDRAVFDALRAAADVIVVGAATATIEGYGPPGRPGQRIGVVSASGRVDTTAELFSSGAGFLVLPEDGPPDPPGIDVVRAGRGLVDVAVALTRLAPVVGDVRFVQAEGGPRLNGALAAAGVIDEINLSLAPYVTGGAGPRLTVGAPELLRRYRPAHVLADDDGYLFTRWVRADP